MSEFVAALRRRVDGAHEKLVAARATERDYEIDLHIARIEDLLDLAARHGVDTATWIDRAELTTAGVGC